MSMLICALLVGIALSYYKASESQPQDTVITRDKMINDLRLLRIIREQINLATVLIKLSNIRKWQEQKHQSFSNRHLFNNKIIQGLLVDIENAIIYAASANDVLLDTMLPKASFTNQHNPYLLGSSNIDPSNSYQQKLLTLQGLLDEYYHALQNIRIRVTAKQTRHHLHTHELSGLHSLSSISNSIYSLLDDIFYHIQQGQINTAQRSLRNHQFLSVAPAVILFFLFMMLPIFYLLKRKHISKSEKKLTNTSKVKQAKNASGNPTYHPPALLTIVSHELLTPVTEMLGMTTILSETRLDNEQLEYTKILHNSGQFLLSMVKDIVNYSKIQKDTFELKRESFQLAPFIQETIEMVTCSARKKGIELHSNLLPATKMTVIGDKLRLRQVLLNILQNAIKYTDHGRVVIYTNCRETKNGIVLFDCSIEDSGRGISDNTKKHLFDAFFQGEIGRENNEGLGLGLSIAFQLIKKMGGHIDVASNQGVGSRFKFTVRLEKGCTSRTKTAQRSHTSKKSTHRPLAKKTKKCDNPLSEKNRSMKIERTPKTGALQLKQKVQLKVLLVEDNEINNLATARLLRSLGHFLISASNGAEVLEILSNAQFDLILMDCQMPDIGGLAATRKLRAIERENNHLPKPIIALTASESTDIKQQCLNAGMNDLITKFSSRDELQNLLNIWGYSDFTTDTETNGDLSSGILQQLTANTDSNEYGHNHFEALCELFLTTTRKHLDHLHINLAISNKKGFLDDLHQILGGARQLGARRIISSCQELQNRFNCEQFDDCDRLIQRVHYEIFRIEQLRVIKKNPDWRSCNG